MKIKYCERCGKVYTTEATNAKYCPLCKPIMKAEWDEAKNRQRREQRAALRQHKEMDKYKGNLDARLKEAHDAGLTYAQLQIKRTLANVGRFEF